MSIAQCMGGKGKGYRDHRVRESQEKTIFLRTASKSQKISLKLEESQEKVRKEAGIFIINAS